MREGDIEEERETERERESKTERGRGDMKEIEEKKME